MQLKYKTACIDSLIDLTAKINMIQAEIIIQVNIRSVF